MSPVATASHFSPAHPFVQKASLEATLRDLEMRYNMEVEKYNAIILRLQEELTKIRNDIHHNSREYEVLLNIKVKLEAEIAEYRRLLDGQPPLKLEDAIETKKVQTKVVTVTQTLVDGKVVSESKDVIHLLQEAVGLGTLIIEIVWGNFFDGRNSITGRESPHLESSKRCRAEDFGQTRVD
ncbi:hypothetical protein INR49_030595 [Caranx melampygus]|nr:hypothetical protein INR49_030595 [Caranx melampygus]